MKSQIFILPFLLSLIAISGRLPARAGEKVASAENPTVVLTLRQALRLAHSQNPELAAADSSVRAAEGRQIQAALLPNPTFFTEADNLIGSGPYRGAAQSESTLQLSQLIELGGKRAARVQVAKGGRALAQFDYESKRLEVLVATTKAFILTLAAQHRQVLADETSKLAGELVPAIRRRVEAGAANAVEVTRAQNAVGTARIEAQQAARDLATARQRLAACWGATNPRFASAAGDFERQARIPTFAVLAQRLGLNPALARSPVEIAQRRTELQRAKADAIPDVTIAVGPRYLAETNDAAIRLNVSVPLPIFNRNQGAIREAQAELDRSAHLQAASANQLTVTLNDAYQSLIAARQEIETLRGTLLPGSEEAFRQVNEGYAVGRFGLLDLLDTRRALVGARVQLLNAQSTYHQALAEIDGLTGRVRLAPNAVQASSRTATSTRIK